MATHHISYYPHGLSAPLTTESQPTYVMQPQSVYVPTTASTTVPHHHHNNHHHNPAVYETTNTNAPPVYVIKKNQPAGQQRGGGPMLMSVPMEYPEAKRSCMDGFCVKSQRKPRAFGAPPSDTLDIRLWPKVDFSVPEVGFSIPNLLAPCMEVMPSCGGPSTPCDRGILDVTLGEIFPCWSNAFDCIDTLPCMGPSGPQTKAFAIPRPAPLPRYLPPGPELETVCLECGQVLDSHPLPYGDPASMSSYMDRSVMMRSDPYGTTTGRRALCCEPRRSQQNPPAGMVPLPRFTHSHRPRNVGY